MAIVNVNLSSVVDDFLALFFLSGGNLHFVTETSSVDITPTTILTYDDSIYRQKTSDSLAGILAGENDPIAPVYIGDPPTLRDDPLISEAAE